MGHDREEGEGRASRARGARAPRGARTLAPHAGPAAPVGGSGPRGGATASPLSGTAAGGTLVTFGGSNLANGSDYRCIFWDGDAKTDVDRVGYVHASYDAPTASVRMPAGRSPLRLSYPTAPPHNIENKILLPKSHSRCVKFSN